jgi:CheY-like chemotaxis protein
MCRRNIRRLRYVKCAMRTGNSSILFVDDDAGVRETTAALLASRGFRLLVAGDGEEALRLLRKNDVDVLLTDIMMPRMNGIELARKARLLRPGLKVLFMTAYFSQAAEAERLGRLLLKPVRSPEIEAELDKLLAA